MGRAGQLFGRAKPSLPDGPEDGRLGWFEGLREGRLCGWAFNPRAPERTFEVSVGATEGERLVVRADLFRADLQAVGSGAGYHGFAVPVGELPQGGAVTCRWTDLECDLPGSPWATPAAGRVRRAGPVRLVLDPTLPGDPRLTGFAVDHREPLRRIRVAAKMGGEALACAAACLFRRDALGLGGDGFHGFILPLPVPPILLPGDLELFDRDRGRRLARVPRGKSA